MKKVGLALGSGAAHGIAHIGVLQVFAENGIPVDFVCGSSAGAVVGAMYCTGADPYLTGKFCTSLEMSSIIDVTVPRTGFLKGSKAENLLAMLTKNKDFESCDPPFGAVACDLLSGKSVLFRSGNIARACHASFAIPGVFAPVEYQGYQLIDGGIMVRVPIEEVRGMGAEYVIGVDVSYRGWGHGKAKNVFEVIMNSFDLSDWQHTEVMTRAADCMITPDLHGIPSNSLEKAEECLEKGREAALAALPQIKRDLGFYE